jgi:hypothetical protein
LTISHDLASQLREVEWLVFVRACLAVRQCEQRINEFLLLGA